MISELLNKDYLFIYFAEFEQLVLANPGSTVMAKLHASNLASMIGEDKIFLRVSDAVLTFAPKMEP